MTVFWPDRWLIDLNGAERILIIARAAFAEQYRDRKVEISSHRMLEAPLLLWTEDMTRFDKISDRLGVLGRLTEVMPQVSTKTPSSYRLDECALTLLLMLIQ
jgi:hypothetical protein